MHCAYETLKDCPNGDEANVMAETSLRQDHDEMRDEYARARTDHQDPGTEILHLNLKPAGVAKQRSFVVRLGSNLTGRTLSDQLSLEGAKLDTAISLEGLKALGVYGACFPPEQLHPRRARWQSNT